MALLTFKSIAASLLISPPFSSNENFIVCIAFSIVAVLESAVSNSLFCSSLYSLFSLIVKFGALNSSIFLNFLLPWYF